MPLKLAIVGRPNVGKSTLFNRLAGKKLAIVDDQPGVTRDRRFAAGNLGDLELILIDTAGFEDVTDDSLEARMRSQTELAVSECDVALFVIDAREGVTPGDEIFGELLRKSGKPVILAANKAEGKKGDGGVMEGYQLGLGEPLAISGEHGEGMAELYEMLRGYEHLAFEEEDEGDKPVRIAIIGRPNAGKSTLVNRLLGEDRLLTGPEAGITRDSISVDWEWEGRAIRLVDTAGLRKKARVQEKLEKLSTHDTIRAITFAEVVLLVMDATHPFEVQDLQLADLVEREGRALVFVLAKWDLVEDQGQTLKDFREHAERMLPQVRGAPVVALSAETGRGIDKMMPAVLKTYGDWSTKVKTRDLNDWLQLAMQRHPPPSVGGKRIKPKYMAQTKARPPTFVLFSSRAEQMPEQYRRYLINSLRESFDLPGVPLRITIKSGKNPYAEGEEKAHYGGAKSGAKGGFRSAERNKKAPGKRAFGKAEVPGGTGSTKAKLSHPTKPAAQPIVRPRSAPRRRPAKP
ncbi:MAG: ribosome biogenesis GTPase Der [Caulobacterales bacterium 68-7]|nr:MAG: ribosome biogenesis GTPase Der [Caulobacterales bacterium 68-7]